MSDAVATATAELAGNREVGTLVAQTDEVLYATGELVDSAVDVGSEMIGVSDPVPVTPVVPPATPTAGITTMMVAGGCFWCVESDLEKVPGVISVVSGYAGGTSDNPTYDDYGSGGHREVEK